MSSGALPERSAGAPDASGPVRAGDEARRPTRWSVRDLLLFFGSAALALLIANLLALTGYGALAPRMGWPPPSGRLGENAFFLAAIQLIFHALIFGYIYVLIRVNYRQPFWEALQWNAGVRRAPAQFLLTGVLLALLVRFAPPLLPGREDFPLQKLFHSAEAAYTIGAFAILVAPFMEELIFRGVLFRYAENLAGTRFAIAATAMLFSGLHLPMYWEAWNHVLLIFVVGFVFSLARGWTGSVLPAYLLHLTYNATVVVILFVETDRFRLLSNPIAN
jgi:membrane protease YdiL (CAAX protease family)